mgnify:FL=1
MSEQNGRMSKMNGEIVERVAKNVGCGVSELLSQHEQVKAQQNSALLAAGKSQEDADLMTLRVAAQQIRLRESRLKRSGCTVYEGMFISVPRYRDWGKLTYGKLAKQLNTLDAAARENLVAQGLITLFERDDVSGGWLKTHNPSLSARQMFEEGTATMNVSDLPDECMNLDDGSAFYAIANKSSPTFPSGGDNFRYGKARRQQELERTSLFLGREQGSGKEPTLLTVKTSDALAKTIFPTFTPCEISLRGGKNNTAYGKAGVTTLTEKPTLATIFTAPPVDADDGEAKGVLPDLLGAAWLSGLDALAGYYDGLSEKERWDNLCGCLLEVCHIDPRENGGYIVTVGDLDLTSLAAPIDLFVPAEHEDKVNFGVGSLLAVVGNTWRTRDDDLRLDVSGWWCVNAIEPAADIEGGAEGWDE